MENFGERNDFKSYELNKNPSVKVVPELNQSGQRDREKWKGKTEVSDAKPETEHFSEQAKPKC